MHRYAIKNQSQLVHCGLDKNVAYVLQLYHYEKRTFHRSKLGDTAQR